MATFPKDVLLAPSNQKTTDARRMGALLDLLIALRKDVGHGAKGVAASPTLGLVQMRQVRALTAQCCPRRKYWTRFPIRWLWMAGLVCRRNRRVRPIRRTGVVACRQSVEQMILVGIGHCRRSRIRPNLHGDGRCFRATAAGLSGCHSASINPSDRGMCGSVQTEWWVLQ